MNVIRRWPNAFATFFMAHNVFFRFMVLFVYWILSVTTPPRHGSIVALENGAAFWILSGIVMAVIPDTIVVAVNHPQSRRSQLILCSVVIVIAVSVMLAYFRLPSHWVSAADLYGDG